MTISSSTEGQINPAVRKQSLTADAKPSQKNSAEKPSSATAETPAVVVETASQQAQVSASAASGRAIETTEQALRTAQSIGSALAQQNSAIANGSASQVAGLLSEFEAAVA